MRSATQLLAAKAEGWTPDYPRIIPNNRRSSTTRPWGRCQIAQHFAKKDKTHNDYAHRRQTRRRFLNLGVCAITRAKPSRSRSGAASFRPAPVWQDHHRWQNTRASPRCSECKQNACWRSSGTKPTAPMQTRPAWDLRGPAIVNRHENILPMAPLRRRSLAATNGAWQPCGIIYADDRTDPFIPT